ncbi:MAG: hypothetical protein AB7F32_10685, partial [Victivallaceae bacterium]
MKPWCALLAAVLAFSLAAGSIEAENGSLHTDYTKLVADDSASGAKAVQLVSPKRNRIDNPAEIPPAATYELDLPKKGTYTVTLRVFAKDQGSDSAYVQLDEGKIQQIGFGKQNEWTDIQVPVPGTLDAGKHSLKIFTREPGFLLDKITFSGGSTYPKAALERYPAPKITPPAGHPRLMVNAEALKEIRRNLAVGENKPVWDRVRKLAATPVSGALDPAKNTSLYGVYDEPTLYAIQARAFLYLVNGDEKAGREAVKAMTDFLRTVNFKEHFQDVTRQMGFTIYCAALVYDWCYPLMTAADREFFIARTEAICGQMEIGFPPLRQGNVTGHAGEAQLFRDLLAIGIAAYDENPNMYRVAAGRFFSEMVEPRNYFYQSGRHHQGNAYGPYRFMWEVYAGWIFRRMTGDEVYSKDLGKMVNAWIFPRLPDGGLLPDGDNFLRNGTYMRFQPALLYTYTYCKDPRAKGEFLRQQGANYALGDPVTFLLLNDPALPVNMKFDDLPLSHYFPYPLPAMIARSGWGFGRAADPVVVEMKGAGVQYNNHHHMDAGSFQIYHRGLLAADPGQYKGYGTPYDWSYTKQSISHNLMLVYDPAEKRAERFHNDGGQIAPNNVSEPENQRMIEAKGYKMGQTTAHAIGPDAMLPLYSYLKCDLSKFYSYRVKDYTRSFAYFNTSNPAQPGVLVVFDRVVSTKPEFRKSWIFNSYRKPEVKADAVKVTLKESGYDGEMAIIPLLPEKANRKIEAVEALTFNGKTFKAPVELDISANPWRTEITPVKPALEDLFLTVMPIGKADNFKVEKVEGANYVGAAFGKTLVTFGTKPGLIDRTLTVEVKAAGTQLLLTDLAAGEWQVKVGGAVLGRGEVKPDDNTLFVVADRAGSYQFTFGESEAKPLPDYRNLRSVPATGDDGLVINGKKVKLTQELPEAGG